MQDKNNLNSSVIPDTKSLIKSLFEDGIKRDIESCRKNNRFFRPYNVPFPLTYEGYGDWRSISDKLLEIECEAKVKMAFFLAYPIKDQIEYYDLICATMANITTDDVCKFFINEVLKHTNSDELRDAYAEKLFILNQNLKQKEEQGITKAAYSLIDGKELLFSDGRMFRFSGCDVKIDSVYFSSQNGNELSLDLSFEEIFDDMFHFYPLSIAKIRLKGVDKLNLYDDDNGYNCNGLNIGIKNQVSCTGETIQTLTVEICSWTISTIFLSCECKRIEVLSIDTTVERDPYEDKMLHLIEIENKTNEDISIRFNKECSPYEMSPVWWGTIFNIPESKFDEIVIPPNGILELHRECMKNECELYKNMLLIPSSHPANIIDHCSISGHKFSISQLTDNSHWSCDIITQFTQSAYDRYHMCVQHTFCIKE